MIFGGLEKFTMIDYPGKVTAMVYTIGCNFRCPYCHNPELVEERVTEGWSEEDVLDFLKTRKGMLDGLVITGGEPTIHEGLLDFIKKVKALGFLVKLDSNGTNSKFLKKVIDEKLVDYIAMDIKAPLSKYSMVTTRPVDIEEIKRSIKILLQDKVDYEFRTTIMKALISLEDIEKIGEEIKGAKKYYLQRFISTKILNPQFKKKAVYTDEELKVFQKLLSKKVKLCEIR